MLAIGDKAFDIVQKGGVAPDVFVYMDLGGGAFTDPALNPVAAGNFTPVLDPENTYVKRFVSEALVNEGSPVVSVAEYFKIFNFNGTGINAVDGYTDQAKFVPFNFTTDLDCGVHSRAGGAGRPIGDAVVPGTSTFFVYRDTGSLIAFRDPSHPDNRTNCATNLQMSRSSCSPEFSWR